MFAHFWLRQCRMVLRPHLYCLPSRFTIVRYLYWILGLCGIWSGVFCSVCADCADDSSAGSCDCLVQGCRCGGFFPNSAVFALVLGTSVLAYGILALPLLFFGYAYGVAFFWLRLLILHLSLSCGSWPWGFKLRAPISGGPCVCVGFFLRRRSCVFFLSSCSAWGRLLLSLFWCCFCASSCGACGFPRRVLLQVTLKGFRNLSGSSCLSCSCGGALLLGWGVFGAPLGFYLVPCSSSGACGLSSLPCRRLPLEVFCLFCHRVPDLLLHWWRRLGGNPSLILSVLLLRWLACSGSLGSAPCVRELPLWLYLLFGRQCNNPAGFPLP